MATYSWMSAPDLSSDTAFRKWCQGIHDAFIACGWVQTADTGQLNLATMIVPATSVPAGYEIFRMNDALQATAPVFVKMEYGKSNASIIGVWVTVGRSTDGAGNVGGVLYARVNTCSSGTSTTEYPCYAGGDGSSIAIVPWSGFTGNSSFTLFIERSRSTAGVATADGLLVALCGWSNLTNVVAVMGYTGTPGSVMSSVSGLFGVLPYAVNGLNASASSTLSKNGVAAPVIPIPCLAPGVTPWVSNLIVMVHPGDAGSISVITAATINGATRTYRAWPAFNPSAGSIGYITGAAITAKSVPAILWEA